MEKKQNSQNKSPEQIQKGQPQPQKPLQNPNTKNQPQKKSNW